VKGRGGGFADGHLRSACRSPGFSSLRYFRTETIDVSDFDHKNDVQVKVEVLNATSSPSAEAFTIYDMVLVGWKD
jgi:hypothetical protein